MSAIRQAMAGQAGAAAALVERAYARWVPVIGRRPAPMDDDYAARCAAGQVFCAMDGDALAGLVVIADAPDHLWLDNLAVDPAWQGRGIGGALLLFVEAEAGRRDLPEVRLLTNERMEANIALYARRGYAETMRQEESGFRRIYMAKHVAATQGMRQHGGRIAGAPP